MTGVELLAVAGRDRLGEGPWWDAESELLWWVDILGRRIRRSRLDGGELDPIETPAEVGFAIPRVGGAEAVAGLSGALAAVTIPAGGSIAEWRTLWRGAWETAVVRVNDGKTDPDGRVWFGTMHRDETAPLGELFRWDGEHVARVEDGVLVSNGLGWSPDGSTMYYADSPARVIWAYRYDLATGAAHDRRVFARQEGDGFPDGLTVDAEGFVWSAVWNGSRLVRYAPDGRIDRELAMPVAKPTSVMFAGPALDVLAVTSARMTPEDGELAGSVFLVDAGAAGRAQARAL